MTSLVLPVLTFGLDLHEFQDLELHINTSRVIPSVWEVGLFCFRQFPIYLFHHLHHMVQNTQQSVEAPI